jgi:acetyltransferase-like isoleucine patch superfamily enzyme
MKYTRSVAFWPHLARDLDVRIARVTYYCYSQLRDCMRLVRFRFWIERARFGVRLLWLRHRRGFRVGRGCKIHSTVVFLNSAEGSVSLGDGVELLPGVILTSHGGKIEIGDRVYIGPYCVLYGQGGLRIGPDTMIATQSVVIPSNHGFALSGVPIRDQPLQNLGIEIGADCWLGCGVRVLDGVKLGDGCVIGAGAVVTRSVPENAIAMGVPARVTGMRKVPAVGSPQPPHYES